MDTEKILKKYVRPWIFTWATGDSHEISASGSTDPESLDFQTEFDPSFGWMHNLSFSLWDSKLTMMNPIPRICSRQPSPPRHHTWRLVRGCKGNHLKISTCSFYVSLAKDYLIQPDFMVNHDQKPWLIPVVQAMSHGFSPEKKNTSRGWFPDAACWFTRWKPLLVAGRSASVLWWCSLEISTGRRPGRGLKHAKTMCKKAKLVGFNIIQP